MWTGQNQKTYTVWPRWVGQATPRYGIGGDEVGWLLWRFLNLDV